MKSKYKIHLTLGLLLATPLLPGKIYAASYQGSGSGERMGGGRRGLMSPDDRLKHMTKDFNLTAEQQTSLKPILRDEQKKMEDLRNDSSLDRQAMRAKMMNIRQDSNSQVRALLDEKQKEKFDKEQQERAKRMQGWRRGGESDSPAQD